jgi:dual specificity tyrosine-phosphorylation-regulated kinase 2/3/4
MQIKDVPSRQLIELASRKQLFFDLTDYTPLIVANSKGRRRRPNTKTLLTALNNCQDPMFLEFIDKCLEWNPVERMTPLEALQHEWVTSGLPQPVLEHHLHIFKGTDSNSIVEQQMYNQI